MQIKLIDRIDDNKPRLANMFVSTKDKWPLPQDLLDKIDTVAMTSMLKAGAPESAVIFKEIDGVNCRIYYAHYEEET